MNNLLKRFLTALVGGGVAVTVIVISPYGSWLFGLIVSMLGLHEFYKITGLKSKLARWYMLGAGALIWIYLLIATTYVPVDLWKYVLILETNMLPLTLALLGIAVILLMFEKQVKTPVLEMSTLAFGFFYAWFPLVLLYLLSLDPATLTDSWTFGGVSYQRVTGYNFRIPLGILMLGWGLDTFAYFGGRFIGGKKLFPRISPKKTWAGTICGAVACVGVGFGLQEIWPVRFNWVVVAGIVAVLAQLGDLAESMFKRGLHIKDSGGILPGHGGMLDRFDGMYLAIPVIYLYYMYVYVAEFV